MKADHVEDIYDLSPTQHGMLFHTLYADGASMYVAQRSYLLEGDLNVPALEAAWQEVIDRHPALRSSFHWEELESPVQVVRRKVKLRIEVKDFRALTDGDREQRMQAYLEADRRRGFDLARAPLMRLTLIRIGDDSHHFTWTYQVMQLDGWSLP